MTEAAIKRAKKKKINGIILIISAVILAIAIVLWIVQFNITNSRAIPQLVEYYEPGEYVEIGENFYVDAKEQLNGYSIRVNGAKLYDYEQFLIDNDCEEYLEFQKENNQDYYKYIVVLDISVKNVENYDGSLMALKFALYNGSLNMPVDFGIWDFIPKSELLIPLDVHVAKISRSLSLLIRKQNDYKAVIELTKKLREF